MTKPLQKIESLRKSITQSTHFCIDKYGRPVRIDRLKNTQEDRIIKEFSIEESTDLLIKDYEVLIYLLFPYCSKLAQKRIENETIIIDIEGYNYDKAVMNTDILERMKIMIKNIKTCYPDLCADTYIVNAPTMFNVAFAIVKPFMEKRTVQKIKILGKNYQNVIHEVVDKKRLPDFLGGDVVGVYPGVSPELAPWNDWVKYMVDMKKSLFGHFEKVRISDPWERAQQATFDIEEHKKVKYVTKKAAPVEGTADTNPSPAGLQEYKPADKPVQAKPVEKKPDPPS